MKGSGFNPTEIIFSATDACNLHCAHCYVSRTPDKLKIEDAAAFIKSACNSEHSSIDHIGFSGGEPFLYIDFLTSIIKCAVENDLMFDRIMTNGVWWQTEEELLKKLQAVYDAGYDGKIGLSFDSFHNQDPEQIITFVKAVYSIWNDRSAVEIQSVISPDTEDKILDLENIDKLAEALECNEELNLNKKTGKGIIILQNNETFLPVYREIQSFLSTDQRAWQSRRWFRDDFCEGPGQILFIHPNGSIAPCCGFSNENPALFIGSITDSFDTVMEKAAASRMISICYTEGLSTQIKALKKKIPGKTQDMCAFCDFVCRALSEPVPES